MNKKALSLAICMAMAIPSVSSALSLGEIQSNSSLNQPFRGKIHLLSANAAEARNLRVKVASADVFNRVGIDRPAFLNSIRFNPTVENGRPVILVSSDQAIHEPFLNFLLEVSWPNGQLLKEYTVLLDPPVLSRPDTAIASNTAGIRAEPRAQGRISRPAIQPARRAQQPTRRIVRAAAPRRAPARRAPVRRPAPAARQVARAPQNRVSSYRVRRGDTLTKVANKLGYNGIRTEQMMMALFQKNRQAFSRNNINNLKAGVNLARPSLQETRAISVRSAKSQIIAQARDWKKARATTVAKVTPEAGNKANSDKNAQVASNQQARLEVSGNTNNSNQANATSSNGNGTLADLNRQLTMLTESLTTKKNENEELKSRVSELESLLRKKNRLITLKSEQLATLQELVGSPTGEESPITQEPQVRESIVNQAEGEGIAVQTEVENNLGNENGQIIRVENEQNALLAQNQQPIEQAQLINQNIPEEVTPEITENTVINNDAGEEPAESTDIMGLLSSPLAMGVGGGSLLALFGGLWFMRRRKSGQYEDFDYDSEIDIDNAEPVDQTFDEPGTVVNIEESVINESELVEHDKMRHEHIKNSGLLDDEEEDLLQEADVYIVYGLHDQAESELKQAIAKDPDNLAYRAKLLENYKAAGNKDAFIAEAKAFMEIEADGKDKYLDDISEWGSALNPESDLFSTDTLKVAAGAGVAMVAGTAVAQEASEALAEDDLISNNQFDDTLITNDLINDDLINNDLESFDLDDLLADESDDTLVSDVDVDLGMGMGLSNNLIDDIEVDAIKIDMGNEPFEIGENDLDELESDISDSMTDSLSTNTLLDESGLDDSDLNIDLSDNSFEFDGLNLDINDVELDMDLDTEIGSLDINVNDKLDSNLDLTKLNLDLDADDFNKIMPEDHQYKNTTIDTFVDGDSDNKEEENLLAEFDDNLSFLDLDNEDTDGIEETHIETKLDLAKAYIDMGDIEGARSTLEEVLQEGSDEQKRIAEELLHQTG